MLNGDLSQVACDTIILDTGAPSGSVLINSGDESTESSIVNVSITIEGTGTTLVIPEETISVEEYLNSLPDTRNSKLDICHIPPGNPENRHVINISVNALKTHVDHHEDYIGEVLYRSN
ncbi:MAG: hypothetical protein Q9M91_04675 [Candidatus Dojkabacteria bacterium]|nr:hypothetical protein [Candidatus Dojkabacteria bacterium]